MTTEPRKRVVTGFEHPDGIWSAHVNDVTGSLPVTVYVCPHGHDSKASALACTDALLKTSDPKLLDYVTTAPEAYDGFGTKTASWLDWKAAGSGRRYRRVAIHPERLDWQRMRYSSGLYGSVPLAEWATSYLGSDLIQPWTPPIDPTKAEEIATGLYETLVGIVVRVSPSDHVYRTGACDPPAEWRDYGRQVVAAIEEAVTRLLTYGVDLDEAFTDSPFDEEPEVDDDPPPDVGPPGSGAVITEYTGSEPGLAD